MNVANQFVRALIFLSFLVLLAACDAQGESTSEIAQASQRTAKNGSSWNLTENKDPITDEVSRNATLNSNESDQNYLAIICYSNLSIDSMMVRFSEYNHDEASDVIYRIDDSEPVEEVWSVRERVYARPSDGRAYIDDFFNKLEKAKRFFVRTKPIDPDVRSETLTFDIKGIDKAVRYVRGAGKCAREKI